MREHFRQFVQIVQLKELGSGSSCMPDKQRKLGGLGPPA